MTPFEVDWEPFALAALAEAYLHSTDRPGVVVAQAAADALLAADPYSHSVELSEGLLKLVIGPLGIVFFVDETTRVVTISGVGLIP